MEAAIQVAIREFKRREKHRTVGVSADAGAEAE